MNQVSGIVSEIKAKTTRFGDMYDVVVNGTPYGHGKYAPRGVKAGDFVTFEVEVKQNGNYTNYNIARGSLRVDGAPSPAAVNQAKATTVAVAASNDKRQETISKQANMNSALQLVSLQLQHGGVKLPAKAPDAFTAINALIADTASKLYKLTTGEDWDVDLATDTAKPQASADAPFDTGEYDN